MAVIAYVLAKVKPGTSEELVGSRKIRGVVMANSVFGPYDAVLVITAKDMDELSKTIYEVVEAHPNVVHTECLISIPAPLEREAAARSKMKKSDEYTTMHFQCPSCNLYNEEGAVFCKFCGYVFNEPRHGATTPEDEK